MDDIDKISSELNLDAQQKKRLIYNIVFMLACYSMDSQYRLDVEWASSGVQDHLRLSVGKPPFGSISLQ
jgi:hypothetical protein